MQHTPVTTLGFAAAQVMLNAREVQFPSKPAVSAECKDFIRKWVAWVFLFGVCVCGWSCDQHM